MAKLSEDAFAILAGCEEARGKTFGITVDKVRKGQGTKGQGTGLTL